MRTNILHLFFIKVAVCILFLSFYFFCVACFASEVINETQNINLDETVNNSEKIFVGLCISKEELEHNNKEPDSRKIQYVFKVIEGVKGNWNNEEIKLTLNKENTTYKEGRKYVLFLSPIASDGNIKLVNILQGELEIREKGVIKKREILINKINIKKLGKNTKIKRTISINTSRPLNYCISKLFRDKKPINYAEFIQLVKLLLPIDSTS